MNDRPFSLCTSFPDTFYRLRKRQYHRVSVPAGTKVLFRYGGSLHGNFLVKNLSASGMLICTDSIAEEFADNDDISDIALALPQGQFFEQVEGEGEAVILPVVNKGRIVRSFGDQGSDLIYHGISFRGDSTVMAELDDLMSKTKKSVSQ